MSVILIADSGSTKTDWVALQDGVEVLSIQTIGLNPYFTSEEVYYSIFNELQSKLQETQVSEIYFYGAGCSAKEKVSWLKGLFSKSFPKSSVNVMHDMLGAARALCGKEAGMVAILGTGSNSCLYDGNQIIANRKALGFILGDEGSGAYIGKQFIQKVLNEELRKEDLDFFYTSTGLSSDSIIQKIYQEAFPNRFLASFSLWVKQNNEDLFNAIARQAFQAFFNKHITHYPNYSTYPLHVIGSVGFNNKALLEEIANSNNVLIGNLVKSPIAGLVRFHQI